MNYKNMLAAVILGVSGTALAAANTVDTTATTTNTTTSTTTTKIKHHPVKHHGHVTKTHGKPVLVESESTETKYPARAELDQQAEISELTDRVNNLETELNQNKGGVLLNDPAQAFEWYKRFVLSGLIDIDGGGSSKTPTATLGGFGRYNKGGSSDISLTNVLLYGDAWINPCITGHLALLYSDNRGLYQIYDQDNGLVATAFPGGFTNPRFTRDNFTLDEGYVRFADFNLTPLFLEAGRFYVPFGNYDLHPITQTLTQQLEQTQATTVELGFVTPLGPNNGAFTGEVYTFRGAQQPITSQRRNINNFGAQMAYSQETGITGFKVDLGYLFNLNDVDYISTTSTGVVGLIPNNNEVGGIATDLLGHIGPFDGHVDFVSAVQRFSAFDVAYNGRGAVPKAVDVGAGYSFNLLNRNTRLGLSYQHSWQASLLGLGAAIPGAGLPQNRVQGDYAINVWRNTNLDFEVHYDDDYSVRNGGTGRDSVTGLVRLAVGIA